MDSPTSNLAAGGRPAGSEVWAEIERIERDLKQATAARPQDPVRMADALKTAVGAVRQWPEAGEVFFLAELLGELSEAYERLDRTGDALAAMGEAIEAGYRSWPDPRCRIAEIHLRAGHSEPAHGIFAQVKVDTPGDVWLYNNAGLEYGHAGDHHRALGWLTEGLELAMRSGDPERLVAQMSDLRRERFAALDRDHDELEARVDAFLADPPPRPPRGWSSGQLPAVLAGLDWAGGTPLAPAAAVPASAEAGRPGGGVQMAFSWFPAAEFIAALASWPQLAQEWGTSDHTEYCRAMQRHLVTFTEAMSTEATAGPAWIVPIRLDAFRSWCARTGHDPGAGGSRASYASERARTTAGEDVVVWPPARNDRCWCGSGRKYKQCCGHPSVTSQPR